jgi:hypothetical protein
MKLRDIINESNTDHISKYGRPGADFEPINSEADEYVSKNKDRYRRLFRDFYKTGEMFVYDTEDHVPKKPKFTNKPKDDDRKSAGYRGNQVTKRRGGLAYDKEVFED